MPDPKFIAQRILDHHPQVPPLVTLEIYPTLRCNLDCQFCDTTDRHRPPQNELPPEQWKQIIRDAAEMGAKQIFVLGGGEPFIYPELLNLLETAKQSGLWGMLTTNGTFLNQQRRQRLLDMGWDEIHISLDGATAKTHDRLRGKHGTFAKIIGAICAFRAEKARRGLDYPAIVLHWVITNQNFREIPAVIRLARSLGIQRIDFDGLIAYTPDQRSLELSPHQHLELQEIARDGLLLANRYQIQTTLAHHIGHQRGQVAPPIGQQSGLGGAPCYKPWHHLTIQADGRISPCCVLAGEGESIRNQRLSVLWNKSPYLQNLRHNMFHHTPTKRCRECSPNILVQEHQIQGEILNLSRKSSEADK